MPNNVKKIQTEIIANGSFEVCFTVYQDFEHYKSGVYTHTSGNAVGGHCVKMIGWGVEKGVDYWLIANSWTRLWVYIYIFVSYIFFKYSSTPPSS